MLCNLVVFISMVCLIFGSFDIALGSKQNDLAIDSRGNNDMITINDFSNEMDQCKDVCTDNFLLPNRPYSQKTCQTGCRFFSIIYLQGDHNLNMSNEKCYLSCDEAYNDYDLKSACNIGCKTTLKKKQSELEAVIVNIEQDSKNIFLMEPDLELFESVMLSDAYNNIQNQIHAGELGGNVIWEYKIPETKIRTMPIEVFAELAESANIKPTGDWLDCASRNSGIPKWILLLAIVSAILVALWLSISSEKKVIGEGDEMLLGEGDEEKQGIQEKGDVDCNNGENLLEKIAIVDDNVDVPLDFQFGIAHLVKSDEVEFSAPPKYSLESEKV